MYTYNVVCTTERGMEGGREGGMSGDALLPLISMSLHKTFRMQRYAIGIIHNMHAVASYSGSPSPFFTYYTHLNIVRVFFYMYTY